VVGRALEVWRFLGGAVAAVMLASSQIEPNPLPGWVYVVVAVLALVTLAASIYADWRTRRRTPRPPPY
jgi:hypothetical protein